MIINVITRFRNKTVHRGQSLLKNVYFLDNYLKIGILVFSVRSENKPRQEVESQLPKEQTEQSFAWQLAWISHERGPSRVLR